MSKTLGGVKRPPKLVEEYLVLLLVALVVLEVTTAERGMVPVGSNPLDLFRLARGHPDALGRRRSKRRLFD